MIKSILKVLALLVAFVLFAYIFWGHPNDSRITWPEHLSHLQKKSGHLEKIGTMTSLQLKHSISIEPTAYKSIINSLKAKTKNTLISESSRFSNPHQLYLAIGSYPERREGHDVYFIPAGGTLSIHLGNFSTTQVSGKAISVGSQAKIETVDSDSKISSFFQIVPMQEPLNKMDLLYKNLLKYLNVNYQNQESQWTPVEFNLIPESSDTQRTVKFNCIAAQDERTHDPLWANGCFLSDPVFYRASEKTPRQFIVVLIDTMRRDWEQRRAMKFFPQLKATSTYYDNALSVGNMTGPATNALLSCQMPTHIADIAFSYAIGSDMREKHYQRNQPSFAGIFSKNHYRTAMIGNISLISEVFGVGVHHGFEENISIESEAYDTPRITKEALQWLESNQDKSFLLYLHYDGGHAPYRAPLTDLIATWPGTSAFSSSHRLLSWLYDAEMRYTDRYLQKLFNGIGQLGMLNSASFVIVSDHADHQRPSHFSGNEAGPGYTGSYFDHGATLLNDEIGVPLLIKTPEQTKPNILHTQVSNLDVGPTLMTLAGLPVPEYCSGVPLPVEELINSQRTLGSEGFKQRAIVSADKFKYIRSYETTDKLLYSATALSASKSQVFMREQLYDLNQDPDEQTNLAHQSNARLLQARQSYRQYYGIDLGYEVVLESRKPTEFSLTLPSGVDFRLDPASDTISYQQETHTLSGEFSGRQLVTLKLPQEPELSLTFKGQKARILKTYMRLPISVSLASLPIEIAGSNGLLDIGKGPIAYIRRVELDTMIDRKISTGNIEFEAVLRQWGYLLDDQN